MPLVSVLCFLLWSVTCLRSDFSWDDADPEILNQAWRLAEGQDIYRDINTPPFAFASYPPLYFLISAFVLKFTGLSFLPSRLISFIAAISIACALAYLSRRWDKSARAGLWAAFLLFLIPAFLYNSARCHPQMLAVAFSIWSFTAFIQNRRRYTLILSPLLALLAIYTKQTQIVLPLAMILYLVLRNRKWLLPYISVLVIGGLIPFLWLQQITDGCFYSNIITFAWLSYNAPAIPGIFIHHAGPLLIFIGIALTFLWKRFRNRNWEEIDCYLLFVFLFTLFSLGRPGAHGQYVMELLAVVLIFLLRMPISFKAAKKNIWVSVQILILLIYAPLFVLLEEGLHNRAANRAYPEIYRMIETSSGPILSQQGSFPLFTRGEIHIQLFHFTGLFRVGAWDQKYLLDAIEEQVFPYVITEFSFAESDGGSDGQERFTPEMLQALRTKYDFFKEVYPYYIYRPKGNME
jgi:4-amino-4-deoxy-L-arabinose transferase-like glycosyltransferase